MKIGIISDTHGKLHPPVLELIASCDVVLHAGDVDNSQTLDQLWMHLKPNIPFYLVRGNNDRGWAERIAKTQRFCQAGVSFFMVHDRKDVSWDLDGVQVVVFGHSHKFTVEEIDGRLWLNPGSCGRLFLPQCQSFLHPALLSWQRQAYKPQEPLLPAQ